METAAHAADALADCGVQEHHGAPCAPGQASSCCVAIVYSLGARYKAVFLKKRRRNAWGSSPKHIYKKKLKLSPRKPMRSVSRAIISSGAMFPKFTSGP